MAFQLEIPTKVHRLSPTDANNFSGDGLKSCIYKCCGIPPAKPPGTNRGHPCAGEAPLGSCSGKMKMQMFISTSLSGSSAGESSFTNSESIASLEKSRRCFVSKSKSLCHTAAVEVLTRKRLLFKHLGGTHRSGIIPCVLRTGSGSIPCWNNRWHLALNSPLSV